MSLREGGDDLLAFFRFPKVQWQIRLRRIDGWWKIASVLSQNAAVAA
jgi:hypothetical protein